MPALFRTSGTPRRATVVAAATAALLALSGCAPGEPGATAAASGVTVTDCGRDVHFDDAPASVLTIGSDAIALLDAAGASDRIVARSGEFGAELPAGLTAPPTAATIIDANDPTTEQIIGSGAEVVIGYGLFNADAEALRAAGIETLTVTGECGHDAAGDARPVDFATVIGDVERFGTLFGTAEAATAAADALRGRVAALESKAPAEARTAAAVYYFSSTSPLSAYGGLSILGSSMQFAGLENIYAAEQRAYLEVSLESLLHADPEVIVLVHGLSGDTFEEARDRLLAEPGVADLAAVKAGRIVGLAANETSSSPAAVSGAEHLVDDVANLPA